jgi:site-specific DNA-methyltransferase (adenine-specific)
MKIQILQGNCIETLQKLDDESINTCITSPPYWGLRNYNGEEKQLGMEDTPEEFVDNLVKVFREVKRVLRDDGTVWLNLGDSYSSGGRTTTTNQSLRGDKDYGVTRPKPSKGIKPKDLIGIPWRVALALQQDGWYLRQDIIWHKPNPMPESVKDRCTKAHEYIFLLSKNVKYYFDNEAIKEDSKYHGKDKKSDKGNIRYEGKRTSNKDTKAQQSFVTINPKKNKRSVWTITTKPFKGAHFATFPKDLIEPCVLAGCPEKICVGCGKPYERVMQKPKQLEVDRNKRSGLDDRKVGGVLDKYNRENPPIDLGVQKQCNCETNETSAGTVLDPFGGSGTTGIVAVNNNRHAVLCELNQEYIDLAKDRINQEGGMFVDITE